MKISIGLVIAVIGITIMAGPTIFSFLNSIDRFFLGLLFGSVFTVGVMQHALRQSVSEHTHMKRENDRMREALDETIDDFDRRNYG